VQREPGGNGSSTGDSERRVKEGSGNGASHSQSGKRGMRAPILILWKWFISFYRGCILET